MVEDDIIREVVKSRNETIQYVLQESPQDMVHIFGRNIEWLYHEIRKLLAAHNDALPQRAKRYVYLIWVQPSLHMNYRDNMLREMLAGCMQNLVEVHNERNLSLALKQNWDHHDPSIYFYESQRYSTEGLKRLWKAFDRTVWYANILVNKAEHKRAVEIHGTNDNTRFNQRGGSGGFRGRYRGRGNSRNYFANKKFYTKAGKFQARSKLPPPPTE